MQGLILDQMCKRYSLRPSEVMGLDDEVVALQFDLGIAAVGLKNESDAIEEAKKPPMVKLRDRMESGAIQAINEDGSIVIEKEEAVI